MRMLLTSISLLAALSISCSRTGVPFQEGGKLSAVERQNLIAIHSNFANWEPTQSAVWVRRGIVRHIYLRDFGAAILTEPYWVFMFDGDGRVVEGNIIEAPNPGTAKTVSSVSPLQVTFEAEGGKTYVCTGEFSQDAWRHGIQREMDIEKTHREDIETRPRSVITNYFNQ